MVADERRRADLTKQVAAAVSGSILRRDDIKEEGGRTFHDYIVQRHVGERRFVGKKTSNLPRVSPAAVAQARVEHEKRGGAPLPNPRVAAVMKVGATAARVQHDRLGGAPLPPLKRR